MAIDFNQVSLVLMAVAFSTWVILPWAFYDGIKRDADDTTDGTKAQRGRRYLKLLRNAQGTLFLSGIFFIAYFITQAMLEVPTMAPLLIQLLPVIVGLTAIFAFLLLFGGLFQAFLVVNYYSRVGEVEREFLNISIVPVFIFNLLLILVSIVNAAPYVQVFKLIGWIYFISLFGLLVVIYASIKWIGYVYLLRSAPSWRGYVALIFLILPYSAFAIYYYLFQSGLTLSS